MLVKSPAWALVVKAIDEQIYVREVGGKYAILAGASDVAEHNVRAGELMAFKLCREYPAVMLAQFEIDLKDTPEENDNADSAE